MCFVNKYILSTLKINHYVKNLIVFIPIIFSKNYWNTKLWVFSFIIFFAFCFVSSSVYILNDLFDKDKDKLHPTKKNRAIASGKISVNFAIFLMLALLACSISLASFLNFYCFLMVFLYFLLNIIYSKWLKRVALIDVACIAIGFIFRIIGGCFAISLIPSPLVILMTFFVSMLFTFSKRKLEFQLLSKNKNYRESLKNFNLSVINQFILLNAVLSITFYFTYVLDKSTIQKAGTDYLYLTVIPFTLLVFRLLFLINTSKIADDPIHFIEKDKTLKWIFVFYLLILFCVLYIG